MSDYDDMPEMCDVIGEQRINDVRVKLKGTGIDMSQLHPDRDVEFEIDPSEEIDPLSVDNMPAEDKEYFKSEDLFKQLNHDCINDDVDSDDDGVKTTPFARIRKQMEDITLGKGYVLKQIIKHGAGSVVPANSLVRAHYNGYLEYSDEPFDSSRLRGKQFQYKLGSGEGVEGWQIAIASMKRGELSRFLLSPDVAYGRMGCPPRIPANAQILFEIEVISFVDQSAADVFKEYSEDEREKTSFEETVKVVDTLRLTGNDHFSLKQYGKAASKYSQALRLLENKNLKNEKEEIEMKKQSLILYMNISLCDLKKTRYGSANKYAKKALEIDGQNVKALYRSACALRHLEEFDAARRQIARAHRLQPGNTAVMAELQTLDSVMYRQRKKQQELSKKMLNLKTTDDLKEEKPKHPANQMVEMVTNTLRAFKESEEQTEITLPGNLTNEEMDSVKVAATELNLHLVVTEKSTGGKNIKVIKN